MRTQIILGTGLCVTLLTSSFACAEIPPAQNDALLNIARQFVNRIGPKLDETNQAMGLTETAALPEGEALLFNPMLGKNIVLDSIITGEVHNQTLLLSLHDVVSAFEFPIQIDGNGAEGSYIRETKRFRLKTAARTVETDQGKFTFSDQVIVRDNDVWVPTDEIGRWFGFTLKPELALLQIKVLSPTPLPLEERMARQGRKFSTQRQLPPELPFKEEPPRMIDLPFVDVSNSTNWHREGNTKKSEVTRNATIATTGDFLNGTLKTQTLANDEDIISNVRATYQKETMEPTLLGPLKARKYELGDVTLLSQDLTDTPPSGLGVHITNKDSRNATLDATTGITGDALPGWDVELYRGNQFLDSQTIGDDGRYRFDKVELFSSENDFRIVLYGPQGEVEEKNIFIPVNTGRTAKRESVYDVSLTMDDTQIYQAHPFDTEDKGMPRLNAQYERPIGNESYLKTGLEAGQNDDEPEAIAHVGVSTTLAQTLVNMNTAADESGQAAAEIITRRNFGAHRFRNTLKASSPDFDESDPDTGVDTPELTDIFSNRFSLNGPVAFGPGERPRYNLDLGYYVDEKDEVSKRGSIGFNTGFGRVSLSQQIAYSIEKENSVNALTNISGVVGKNRLRLTSDYEISPEKGLSTLRGSLQRSVTPDINIDMGVTRDMRNRTTEGNAQMNWYTGKVALSPSLSYNSDGDIAAMMNTRFGVARDPQQGSFHMFDRALTLNGGASALVFLDANGNGKKDEGEQPIENAVIAAPQNGGRETTNKDGFAFFSRMERLRLTDVYIEPDSLQDPYWVPATRGVSILPREGHVTELQFPVLMAGEIEGVLHVQKPDGDTSGLAANIPVALYDKDGKRILNTDSGDDGYYLLSPIPPGNYYMLIGDANGRSNSVIRPAPVPITIGYDGKVISGKDFTLLAGTDDAPVNVLTAFENPPAKKIILNLGTYKSNLLMGLMWYKARSFQADAVAGLKTLVAPINSYAAANTGLHTLRIGNEGLEYNDALKRCGQLNAGGIKCTLEILPGGLERFSDTAEAHAAL